MANKLTNGIDYTPKNKVVVRKQEHAVFNSTVREQRAPFFEVHVAGHSVVFTDSRTEAHSALQTGHTYPRTLTMVNALGRRTLLEDLR